MYVPNIVIEGPDLSGKTSLQKGLLKATDLTKKMFVSDRSILTRMLYASVSDNYKELSSFWKADLVNFLSNNGMIFLTCSNKKDIEDRYKARNDESYNLEKIHKLHDSYNSFFSKYLASLPSVDLIDSSSFSENFMIKEAKRYLEYFFNKMTLATKVKNLIQLTSKFGDKVGNTIELRNVNIRHVSSFPTSRENIVDLLDKSYQYVKKNNNSRYKMDINDYKCYYDMILKKMTYTIKKELVFLKAELFESRRFHVISDAGSCVYSLGINFRKIEDKFDMYITSNIRSSDVVILPFDIDGIESVIEEIIKPKTAKYLFGFKLPIDNFYYNINFESIHVVNPENFNKEYNK